MQSNAPVKYLVRRRTSQKKNIPRKPPYLCCGNREIKTLNVCFFFSAAITGRAEVFYTGDGAACVRGANPHLQPRPERFEKPLPNAQPYARTQRCAKQYKWTRRK